MKATAHKQQQSCSASSSAQLRPLLQACSSIWNTQGQAAASTTRTVVSKYVHQIWVHFSSPVFVISASVSLDACLPCCLAETSFWDSCGCSSERLWLPLHSWAEFWICLIVLSNPLISHPPDLRSEQPAPPNMPRRPSLVQDVLLPAGESDIPKAIFIPL